MRKQGLGVAGGRSRNMLRKESGRVRAKAGTGAAAQGLGQEFVTINGRVCGVGVERKGVASKRNFLFPSPRRDLGFRLRRALQ